MNTSSYLIFLFTCVVITTTDIGVCLAQNRTIDSLEKLLASPMQDTTRVKTLVLLANFLRGNTPRRSRDLAFQALRLAEKSQFEIGKIQALIGIASSYSRLDKNDTALVFGRMAVTKAESIQDQRSLAQAYDIMGVLTRRTGNYDEAANLHRKALHIAEQIQDDLVLSYVLKNLAVIYLLIRQYDYALEVFHYGLSVASKLGDKEGIAIATGNIGFIFTELKQFDSAASYCQQSLRINEEQGNKRGITIVLSQLATIKLKQSQYDSADSLARQALSIGIAIKQEIAEALTVLAFVALKKKDYHRADSIFRLSLREVGFSGNPPYIRLEIYQGLYQLAKARNQPTTALSWFEQFYHLSDSLHSIDRIKRINELQMRYEKQKDEEKIKLLQQERRIQGFAFSTIAIISSIFLVILIIANRRRDSAYRKLNTAKNQLDEAFEKLNQANLAIQSKNTELHESLETLRRTQTQLAQAEKMASLGTLVAGVAHELNTPIGVAVTAASTLHGKVEKFEKEYKEGGLKKSTLEAFLENAKIGADLTLRNLERAANLIQSFKQVAVDQTSDNKRVINLKHYLEGVITSLEPKWKTTQHRVEIECDERVELETYPGAIAQIITNLIDNSLLHGFQGFTESGTMRVVAEKDDGRIMLTYSDNGRGIPPEVLPRIFDPFFTTKQAQGGTGLGMHIVYNLITQKLEGKIRCESEVGKGTIFIAEIPM